MMLKTLATIGMLSALVIGIFIGFLVNEAYAEETVIAAENSENSILIAFDGDLSYILYETSQGISEHYDGKLKVYSSGGFSVKNYETGIAIWGHFNGDSYDLFVLTSDGVDRFTGYIQIEEIEVVEEKIDPEYANKILKEYWENRLGYIPDDSLGVDISKWDIPSEGRSDYEYVTPGKEFDPDTLDMIVSNPNSVQYKHTFSFDVIAINTEIASKKDQRIQDVTVIAKVTNPIGELVQYWKGITDKYGKFEASFFVPDNTMLGLYTLQIVADLEKYTTNTKSIPFYVTPQDKDGLSSCPTNYMRNSTSLMCQKICEDPYIINYVKNICEAKN